MPFDRNDTDTTAHLSAFTLFTALWAPVEYRAKQMTPWLLMTRGFQPAQDALLLNYVDRWDGACLFSAFRRRHWLVFSAVAAAIVTQIATVASSGLLMASQLELRREGVGFVARESFSASQLPPAGSRPASFAYGVMSSNLSAPLGTSGHYAFQWFEAPASESPSDTVPLTTNCRVFNLGV